MRDLCRYPPLLLLLGLVLGILLSTHFDTPTWLLLFSLFSGVLLVLGLLVLKIFGRTPWSFQVAMVFILSVLLGAGSFVITDSRKAEDFFGKCMDDGEPVLVTAAITENLKSNKSFDRYVARVLAVNSVPASGKFIVNLKKDLLKSFKIGTVFSTKSVIHSVEGPKNPFEFNYAAYLQQQQIYHQLFADTEKNLLVHGREEGLLVQLQNFRSQLIEGLSKRGVDHSALGVISALLLGERRYLSSELRASYINAGAIHILAISGLHVGILFLMFSYFLKPLLFFKYGKLLHQVLVLLLLWLFAVLAGLSPSVVRAVTMFSFVGIGLFLNRKNGVYQSLVASAFFLLLAHPRFLFEVGFQLSYTAVLSIVWLQPKFAKMWKPKFKPLKYFWQLLTVSCAAQLGVLPLSLYYFHQFPSLFFLSNIVVVPLLGVILGCGIVVLVIVAFDLNLDVIIRSYAQVIVWLNDFIAFIAAFEPFVIKHIYWSMGLLCTSYVVLLFFFKYVERRTPMRLGFAALAILSFHGVLFYEFTQLKKQNELLIFHRNRATLIGSVKGRIFQLWGVSEPAQPEFIDNFRAAKGIEKIRFHKELPYAFLAKEQAVVVVDSLGLYQFTAAENPVVLLTNSPKINLERLIQQLKPSLIISDGSNYRSYAHKWEQSALQTNTPFYNTAQKGAFKFY